MKSQPSSSRFTNQSLKKQVFKYTPLVAAIGTALLMSGCNSNDPAPPPPSEAIYEIMTGGGSNTAAAVTTGTGGDGGYVDMYKYGGFSELGIFSSGAADASFTARSVTANLGSNALNVAADTTVDVLAAEPAAGTAYFVEGDTSGDLYISDGDGILGNDVADTDELPVSGISIDAGITLTLTTNNTGVAATSTAVDLSLDNDLDNNGTITTTDDVVGGDRGDLDIDLSSYMGDGNVDTSGTTDGQSGGDLDLVARGIILNNGGINTSGADSTTAAGGDGGYIDMYSDHHLQNTADMDSHGGSTTAAFDGGDGGYIYLYADEGTLWNSGDMSSIGGNGDNGGDGGSIDLYTYYYSDILNSGNGTASGGAGSVGTGGDGGSFDFYANGANLYNNADLVGRGGAGVTAGGDGSDIDIYNDVGDTLEAGGSSRVGDVEVSGNIDIRGGDASDAAGNAGDGGYLELDNYPEYYGGGNNALRLLGYNNVDTSGGNGASGGDGGSVDLYADYGFIYSGVGYGYGGCGKVVNEVTLNTTGGDSLLTTGADGNGGDGGYVDLESCYDYATDSIDPETGLLAGMTTNSATIDTSGGANVNATSTGIANAGSVWLWGYNGVTNTADITANGGNDLAADLGIDGFGGDGGDIELYAEDVPIENSGALTANGGDGEFDGGDAAGNIDMYAVAVTNSGDITGNGGNADAALAASTGGDGADIEIYVTETNGADNSGSTSNTGGTGETEGTEGTTYIGGHCVSGDCS